MLEDDFFLTGLTGKPFTNPTFHKLLANLSLVNTEIPVPKIAYIISKVVQVLQSRAPGNALPETSSFHPGEGANGAYDAAMRFARRHAGKHWATHASQGLNAPTQTCLSIVIPKEVRLPERS